MTPSVRVVASGEDVAGRVWAIPRPRRDDPRREGRVREPRAMSIDFRGLRGCGSPIVGFTAVCAGAFIRDSLFVLALLVHVPLVLALPREVIALPPALVQRDEEMRAKVAVREVDLRVDELLLGRLHGAAAHVCPLDGGRRLDPFLGYDATRVC